MQPLSSFFLSLILMLSFEGKVPEKLLEAF